MWSLPIFVVCCLLKSCSEVFRHQHGMHCGLADLSYWLPSHYEILYTLFAMILTFPKDLCRLGSIQEVPDSQFQMAFEEELEWLTSIVCLKRGTGSQCKPVFDPPGDHKQVSEFQTFVIVHMISLLQHIKWNE